MHFVHLVLLLSQLVKMTIKICEFIGQIIGVRNDVECFFAKFLLHLDDIGAKSIFSSDLDTIWKVIDFLVIIETFIDILFI